MIEGRQSEDVWLFDRHPSNLKPLFPLAEKFEQKVVLTVLLRPVIFVVPVAPVVLLLVALLVLPFPTLLAKPKTAATLVWIVWGGQEPRAPRFEAALHQGPAPTATRA